MARLCAVADGNNTSASTWALIDSTSFIENETTVVTVPTSYSTSYNQFAPGAITIDGIGIRLASRIGTTGTFSVELYNQTLGASVAGTEVTINCSDFVDALSSAVDGGWYFFKFSSVLLLAANNYSIRFKTSTSTQISLLAASSTNISRFLRTTTTQAPVAGDDRFVMGEWTAAGTVTTRTVTLNDTANTDYGSASTSIVNPALSISANGVVEVGTSASTTYLQKISGNVVVYNGGKFNCATSGSRMPTTSSFVLTMDSVATVDFGVSIKRKGECKWYGESKTRWTLLTSDEAASSTSIQVVSTSGWKNGDTLCFAGTGTTITQGETRTISTVDSGTQVTLTTGLTNARTGTGDVIGEVGNLSSNVKIVGTSTSVATYFCAYESSLVVLDNVEIQYFGSSTTNKRGVECLHTNTSSNSCTFINCAFRNVVNSNGFVGCNTSSSSFFYINDNVLFTTANSGYAISGGGSGTPTFNFLRNLAISTAGASIGIAITGTTGDSGLLEDNIASGYSTGLNISTAVVQNSVTTVNGFKLHSNSVGVSLSSGQTKILNNCDIVSNNNGISTNITGDVTFNNCNFYGNGSSAISISAASNGICELFTLNNCVFRGRTSFNQPCGINIGSAQSCPTKTVLNSCTFGVTIAHTTADIIAQTLFPGQLILNSCTLASTTEITSTAYSIISNNSGYIGIQRKDDVDGAHTLYTKQAIVTPDTSIYRTATPSIRIAPKSATIDCNSYPYAFKVPVNNGQTCTPTLYVRESESGDGAAYNGSRIKLYVKSNVNAGITSDTLLDTATASSDGAWEALTGSTAAVTDDCELEFYIVANGTTGWINIDDFSFVNA